MNSVHMLTKSGASILKHRFLYNELGSNEIT